MISLFTVPKPFIGKIGITQNNALASWRSSLPNAEIFVAGDERGVKEIAKKYRLRHLAGVIKNEFGTPLLDSVFRLAHLKATRPVLGYINADIILLRGLDRLLPKIGFENYLLAGQRFDVDVNSLFDFQNPNCQEDILAKVKESGSLHHPAGSDYFLFPRGSFLWKLPPFAVGRPAWDNWFIYNALQKKIPVIDLSLVFKVIHQNHDYRHVPQRRGLYWEGPEGDQNIALAGDKKISTVNLLDATHLMTPLGPLPAYTPKYLFRRFANWADKRGDQ